MQAHTIYRNYTNTKLKAWCRCLLRHPARKRSRPILHPQTHTGDKKTKEVSNGARSRQHTLVGSCGRFPVLWTNDWQADLTFLINVWMVDLCLERDLWWLERILSRKIYPHAECTLVVRRTLLHTSSDNAKSTSICI